MAAENETRPRALVTGASAGIGMAFAECLARDGFDLVVVARRRDRLEDLARRLEADHSVTVQVLAADLTDSVDLREVEQQIRTDDRLRLLVNNAGFAGYMPFIDLDPDRAEDLIRLHVLATTRLTRAALPGMIDRGRGAIINVSSLLGFSASMPSPSPLPKRAVYAGCKAYINTFTETLYHELEGTGVQMQLLCPGIVRGTEFHGHVPGFDQTRADSAAIDAHGIVRASFRGLEMGEVVCVPGLDDPALVDQIRADERQLLGRAARGGLAERYGE